MYHSCLTRANDVQTGEVMFWDGEGREVFGLDGVVDTDQFVTVDGVDEVDRALSRRAGDHEARHLRKVEFVVRSGWRACDVLRE